MSHPSRHGVSDTQVWLGASVWLGYENDVSSKIAFVQGFDDEPGSNVMSFSQCFELKQLLTARKYMDFAVWLMTQPLCPSVTDKMN